jgi:transposase
MQQRRFTKEFVEKQFAWCKPAGECSARSSDLGIGLPTLVRWIGRSRDRHAIDPAAAEGDVTAGLKGAPNSSDDRLAARSTFSTCCGSYLRVFSLIRHGNKRKAPPAGRARVGKARRSAALSQPAIIQTCRS